MRIKLLLARRCRLAQWLIALETSQSPWRQEWVELAGLVAAEADHVPKTSSRVAPQSVASSRPVRLDAGIVMRVASFDAIAFESKEMAELVERDRGTGGGDVASVGETGKCFRMFVNRPNSFRLGTPLAGSSYDF